MNVANTQVSNISKLTNRKPSTEMNSYGSALSQGHGVTYPNMFGTLPMDYGYPRPPQFQSSLPAPMNRRQYQFQYRY